MGKIIRDGNIITPTTYIAPKVEPEYVSFGDYSGTTLDLSWLRTNKMTNMQYMFNYCSELTSIDVSNFNTSKVTDMSAMFSDCSSLTSLDLSSFNTSKVTNMEAMFNCCTSLTSLDLSNFNFANVTSYTNMFSDVPANCEILVKDEASKTWITSKFSNLTNVKVKGGN